MSGEIKTSATNIDLTGRLVASSTIVASPTAAVETTICTVTIPSGLILGLGVILVAQAGFTIGANGVTASLRIRQTGTSGSAVGSSGPVTVVAASAYSSGIVGIDTAPLAAGVYVLTLTVASATATSSVSAAKLVALAA
jgi:hypothetical protein